MKKLLSISLIPGLYYLNNENNFINFDNQNNDVMSRKAICILYPDNNSGVTGLVSFSQNDSNSDCKIVANVRGLSPNSLHGIHIHKFGDLTNGCITAGPHFNPFNKTHAGPSDVNRHIGDLGNIKTDEKGNGYMAVKDHLISLFGENSVIGRSVVVHKDEDDLGRGGNEESLKTGNAGARLACGLIGISDKFYNLEP